MSVKDNIYLYLENKGVSPTKAERLMGWGVGALTKANSITAERLKEFVLFNQDVSAEWLLRGEGEMKKQSSEIVSEDNIKIDINMDSKDVVIKALTEKIQRLESENAELRRKYEPSE